MRIVIHNERDKWQTCYLCNDLIDPLTGYCENQLHLPCTHSGCRAGEDSEPKSKLEK